MYCNVFVMHAHAFFVDRPIGMTAVTGLLSDIWSCYAVWVAYTHTQIVSHCDHPRRCCIINESVVLWFFPTEYGTITGKKWLLGKYSRPYTLFWRIPENRQAFTRSPCQQYRLRRIETLFDWTIECSEQCGSRKLTLCLLTFQVINACIQIAS